MWKKLFLLAVIIWMVSPAYSAVIECVWSAQMSLCNTFNITPVTQPDEAITINGQASDFVSPGTTYVSFYNQVFQYLPTGIFTLFPKLVLLNLHKLEVTSLSTDSFPNCGDLTQLSLSGGQFDSVPAGVFQSCKSISFLGFAENSVKTIDVDALRGLTNLTAFVLMLGKLSCIPLNLFQHNPVLSQVQLYGNQITAIDSNAFANLPNLVGIYLGMNLITYIPTINLAPPASNNTQINIDFASNPIYAITPDLCSNIAEYKGTSVTVSVYNVSSITNNAQVNTITSLNCQDISSNLQNCYSNWTSSMTEPVTCGIEPTTTTTTTTTTTSTTTTLAPTTTTTSTTTTLAPTTLPPVRPGSRPHHFRKCHPIKKVD